MGLFKKKEVLPPTCQHKWKDFNWYIDANYYIDECSLEWKVMEPYVCIRCLERKTVELINRRTYFKNADKAQAFIDDFTIKHPQIKDRVDVEDEVNDFILVDREYLEIRDMVVKGAI